MSPVIDHSEESPWIASQEIQDCADQVKDLLDKSPYYSLRTVECDQKNGQVVLSGTVANYHLKQIAQTVAISVTGLGRIRNQLFVTCHI